MSRLMIHGRAGAERLAVVLGLIVALAAPASAQQAAPARSGEIVIEIESFGVGQVVRSGSLSGVRVALTDSAVRPREVVVRLSSKDADGDEIQTERAVTLNPGQKMGVWLYWFAPFSLRPGSVYTISVRAATVGDDGETEVGRQLGAQRIQTGEVVHSAMTLIGVVGRGALMGLDQFELTEVVTTRLNSRHGAFRIVGGLTPAALPDHWKGYDAFHTLVWMGEDPNELSTNQARALEEWVRRGGHLVLPLRSVGAEAMVSSPLGLMLPEVEIRRRTGVDLEHYRTLLTDDEATELSGKLPESVTIHEFVVPLDAERADASCIISGLEGCIVARRLLGVGRVTLVGIDLVSRDVARIVQADRFWNRILGLRGDVPPGAGRAAAPTIVSRGLVNSGGSQYIDDTVVNDIAKSRAAGVGLLLGIVVFITYWFLAGPVGFAALKARSWQHHAWVGFVGVALVFTLVSWFSVNAARPTEVEMRHLTLLQHVHGQPQQRARVFASILLPEYGEQRVEVGEAGVDQEWRQVIWPFMGPAADEGLSFPDARAYQISSRNMDTVEFPARSTMKQIRAEWLGGPRWTMPIPTSPDAAPALGSTTPVAGRLIHQLPAPLEDGLLIVVERQTSEREEIEDDQIERLSRLRAVGRAVSLKAPWAPGVPLDLALEFSDLSSESTLGNTLKRIVPIDQGIAGNAREVNEPLRQKLIALLSQLEPPDYTRDRRVQTSQRMTLYRQLTHGFDLGVWFTEPCLIILGAVDGVACPVPVSVDGRPIGDDDPALNSGRVLVQWVYPLGSRPVHFTNPPEPEVTP